MKPWTLLAIALAVSGCTTTRETKAKLVLPTEAEIKNAELRDWVGRVESLRRFEQLTPKDTDVQLSEVRELQCTAMFNAWVECSFIFDLTSNGKTITTSKQFGQYEPQADGQWNSAIIMWHERRR